jgi:hypothetical protein
MTKTACNLEAEQAILAGILCGADFDFSKLSPEEFFFPLHRRLYSRLQAMDGMDESINVLAVIEPMGLDPVETAEVHELHSPMYGPFTPENLSSYARLIKRDFCHGELQRMCETLLSANGDIPLRAWEVQAAAQKYLDATSPGSAGASSLTSCSTAGLFSAQEKSIEWMCWPFAAVGLASILDALPKLGKTVFFLHGIHASRENRQFLNFPTRPMRVLYVSEQSRASLAMQARETGFHGDEPIEELRWVTREDWSRYVYTDFLLKLEKEILEPGRYNCMVIDTLHTVARMEDEKDASEVNRLGNLTLDVATRHNLALVLGRHDRKSGGEVGVSGRSSIQLSGLVDVILHLVRVPNQSTQRRLELLGRVPGLPCEQMIELMPNGEYLNWGEPVAPDVHRLAQVAAWLRDCPTLTAPGVVAKFAEMSVEISLSTAKRYCAKAREESDEPLK